MTFHLGRWEDVLCDVECDALICDPPYGARTHESVGLRDPAQCGRVSKAKIAIDYAKWTAEDVRAFVASWAPRTRGWMVALTSHDLIPAWTQAYDECGRYSFAPVPCIMHGGSRHPAEATRMKSQGVRAGVPDLLIFIRAPARPEARGIAIEMKRRHGSHTSAEQRAWLAALEAEGWLTMTAKGWDEARVFLETMGWGRLARL